MVPIVIPACHKESLVMCVDAIRRNEPFLNPGHIVQVLDGIHPGDVSWDGLRVLGQSPFSFARNVNKGIRCWLGLPDCRGVILCNQDAVLETPGGFSALVAEADRHPEYGVMSAAVRGDICNPVQLADTEDEEGRAEWAQWITTDATVCFVAVYIPRRTLDAVGLLDERITGYGRDDDLYCLKARKAGFKLGVWHGCVVEHKSLPSAYRTNPDLNLAELADRSLRIFAGIVAEEGLDPWLSADQCAAIGGLTAAV